MKHGHIQGENYQVRVGKVTPPEVLTIAPENCQDLSSTFLLGRSLFRNDVVKLPIRFQFVGHHWGQSWRPESQAEFDLKQALLILDTS